MPRPTRSTENWANWPRNSRSSSADRVPRDPLIPLIPFNCRDPRKRQSDPLDRVNNAGFGRMAMFEDTTEEYFDRFVRVLLKGPYFLTQTLLPLMADGGAVVNTTSNAGMASGLEPGYSAYVSMKGGLIVLTRYMAKEFGVRGIRVIEGPVDP
ncbi:SDR family NAD(P)-dependent oxidoreductase [Streptomyces sp. NPDC050988]|uniref:SDR family NAD(P)-dependent oxidoreductase n=1 Tax=Streptomyces sp. NPDC050988 TaxID=3365637 RepID=UPI0037A9D3EC